MRRAGVPLLALCIALALAACGGSDAEQGGGTTVAGEGNVTSNTAAAAGDSPTTAAEAGDGASARSGKGEKERPTAESGGDDPERAGPEPGTKAVAPGVPAQGEGDNSVQIFGVEGAVEGREQAFSTLRAYLKARAAGDWVKACAETSEEFKEQLATMVRLSGSKEKPEGCIATLRLLLGSLPRSEMPRAAEARDLLSFRVEEGYAYVIFRGADGAVRFMAMADDDGEWKVNTTDPSELPSGS